MNSLLRLLLRDFGGVPQRLTECIQTDVLAVNRARPDVSAGSFPPSSPDGTGALPCGIELLQQVRLARSAGQTRH